MRTGMNMRHGSDHLAEKSSPITDLLFRDCHPANHHTCHQPLSGSSRRFSVAGGECPPRKKSREQVAADHGWGALTLAGMASPAALVSVQSTNRLSILVATPDVGKSPTPPFNALQKTDFDCPEVF